MSGLTGAEGQNRAMGLDQDRGDNAPGQESAQPRAAVRSHGDEISSDRIGHA